MIAEPEVARAVSGVLTKVFDELGETIVQVNTDCSPEEAAAYREKIGDIFYILVFKLLEPIYEQHPELKPPGWT